MDNSFAAENRTSLTDKISFINLQYKILIGLQTPQANKTHVYNKRRVLLRPNLCR